LQNCSGLAERLRGPRYLNVKCLDATPTLPLNDQLPEELLTATVSAFIHHLTNRFLTLKAQADTLVSAASGASGNNVALIESHGHAFTESLRALGYMLQRLRNTVGRRPGVLRKQDVDTILHEVKSQFPADTRHSIGMTLRNKRCEVTGDRELLWHLFENLIRNGLEAIDGRKRGRVWVSTSIDAARKMVRIVVRDNGRGIPPANLFRVFDPDFSTKPGGLGVGLYLVRRAAAIHGGTVECTSELSKGTTFTVLLPIRRKDT